MTSAVRVFVCVLGLSVWATTAAQTSSAGKEFILTWAPSSATRQLKLTSEVATNVTVQYPMNGPFTLNTTVAVGPGSITTVDVPLNAALLWNLFVNAGIPLNNCVHAFAADDFTAYQVAFTSASSDAGLTLPVSATGTEYLLMDYHGYGQFLVAASENGTTVTITPTASLDTGHLPGVTYTVALNRGEGYYEHIPASSGFSESLTGTRISSNKPITVRNGTSTYIPSTVLAADEIFEYAQPVEAWGRYVLAANLPNRPGGSIYRVLAAEDDTTVTLDGGPLASLDSGEYHDTGSITGDHVFEADQPVFVVQFMTGNESPGAIDGDPAMVNLAPVEQFLTGHTFATFGDTQFDQHFLTVYAKSADVATITMDSVPIGSSAFTAIAGTTYSVARLELERGVHATSSTHPHGITVEGYDFYDSYIYSGGANFPACEHFEDFWEENDTCETASPLPLNMSFAGMSTAAWDEDWYRITVPANSILSLDVLFSHAGGDVNLHLYGACSGPLLTSSLGTADNEHLEWKNSAGVSQDVLLQVFMSEGSPKSCNDYGLTWFYKVPWRPWAWVGYLVQSV